MIEVDGSAGGGQLLRTALALAAVQTQPVTLSGVRENRPEPGLRPQHLEGLQLLARICNAEVEGATVGSTEVVFHPESPTGGEYHVDIGTAGSITLLFDTVLPLATGLNDPLVVSATGGTDVKWSPPIAAHQTVKLPLLRRHGLHAAISLERTGYYPKGGGTATLLLAPSSLTPLRVEDRGDPDGARVYSKASLNLADQEVAERQLRAATEALTDDGWSVTHQETTYEDTASPGSSLSIRLDFEHTIIGGDALGERGKPAETVATEAVTAALGATATPATVDPRVADQLVVFLALAGGRIRVPAVTSHIETSLELLEAFGSTVTVSVTADTPWLVGSPE